MKIIHVFTVFGTPYSFFDGQFKYLVDNGYEILLISSYDSNALDFAKRNNIKYKDIEIPRKISITKILYAIIQLINIILKEKPVAVFGHTPVATIVAMTASYICRVKNRIYYRHGLIYTTMKGIKRIIFKYEEKFVSLLSTAVINVSKSLSNLAITEKLNKETKQYVIGNGTCGGIDAINLFNPSILDKNIQKKIKNELQILDNNVIFGFCGRICYDKGISELLQGYRLFTEKHNNINSKLLLIGNLDARDVISNNDLNEIKNNKNIILCGYIDKRDIAYYYNLLDVFIFPSHREGFGMSVIEASAMCKPILVSKSHGCIDSIIDDVTGEYIDLNPMSICNGMEKMLDEKYRETIGNNGRKFVLKYYDHSVMYPQILELYHKIIK